jgi:hypothetical protein
MKNYNPENGLTVALITARYCFIRNGRSILTASIRTSVAIAVGLLLCTGTFLRAQTTGCAAGPYTSCTNPIPATFLSGSWVDTGSATEWEPSANNATPGTTGNVTAWATFPPMSAFNPAGGACPVVTFQIASSSSYTPSSLPSSSEGSTAMTWTADSPSPNTTCGGWTPVSSLTISGTVANKGNDTMSGTYSNSSGGSGPWSMVTNLMLAPTSESLALTTRYQSNGFGPTSGSSAGYQTVLFVNQTLADSLSYDPPDPNGNKFAGRQVYELQGPGTTSDGCYSAAQSLGYTYPGGPFAILGSVWNVGGLFTDKQNAYGSDQIGWQTAGVGWYRLYLGGGHLPCTATLSQAMDMVVDMPGYSNVQFATHTMTITIDAHSVTVTKDGLSSTETTF